MHLEHKFSIPAPVDQAWEALMDVRRVGECLPGATITSVDGDDFTGALALKVGPVNANYQGSGRFERKDADARVASIVASGNERRGAGSANATITALLIPEGQVTHVEVSTELAVTGRLAQIGRGPMSQISAKMMAQFADNLRQEMERPAEDPDPGQGRDATSHPTDDAREANLGDRSAEQSAAPLNVMRLAFSPKQRVVLLGGAALLVVAIIWVFSRSAGS